MNSLFYYNKDLFHEQLDLVMLNNLMFSLYL